MLESHIVTRIREYLAAELATRDRALDVALTQARPKAGMSGWSLYVSLYSDAGRDELAVRAGIIWTAVRRSHASLKGTYTDGILEDLRQQIREHLDAQSRRVAHLCADRIHDEIKKHQDEDRAIVEKQVLGRGDELIPNLDIEAQFYVNELKRAGTTPAAGTVMNFHAPVGAVQTAPFATANVSLAGAEGARLVAALEALRQAIERTTEGTSEQRAAGTEIVADTIAAVKSEKPNAAKVAGLLGGLATTVQTTASLQGAWQFVKAAAAAVGIPLP